MPKIVSQRQLRANRANAQRSTGPKTPQGKARSSLNALSHGMKERARFPGLNARDVVITTPYGGENQADFTALLQQLHDDLRPQNVLEQALVERVATSYWRLLRTQRYEVHAIREAVEDDDSDPETTELIAGQVQSTAKNLRESERLLAQLNQPNQEDQEGARKLRILLTHHASFRNPQNIDLNDPELRSSVRDLLEGLIARDKEELESLRIQQEQASAEQSDRQERYDPKATLPDEDALHCIVRYETMLDRSLHRAVSELRRLRRSDWALPVNQKNTQIAERTHLEDTP